MNSAKYFGQYCMLSKIFLNPICFPLKEKRNKQENDRPYILGLTFQLSYKLELQGHVVSRRLRGFSRVQCLKFIFRQTSKNSLGTQCRNRPFSYSEKESQSNETLLHFVEFSNVHNSDRTSNATRSNLVYKNV